MRSGNPAFNSNTFTASPVRAGFGETMTVNGTIHKTGILFLCVLATAAMTWSALSKDPSAIGAYIAGGAIGGLVFALVTVFKKEWSAVTAPLYALCEGAVLGSLSGMLETMFPGIAMQAVGLTFGTCFVMLLAYRSGLLRATRKFTIGVIAATGGIALVYLTTMVLGMFGVQVPAIYGSGTYGILFSLAVVVIAALNLILDFDLIEKGAAQGAPKYMEWYGAFGLMVTLIWLYIEMLRLLTKMRRR
ncbi:MAG TPA: Bax inhibitor-1/YccA family protein [Bryobacteraceae bacterium]|jgi:uncharacterized YccA/Bax inhibitor family protein